MRACDNYFGKREKVTFGKRVKITLRRDGNYFGKTVKIILKRGVKNVWEVLKLLWKIVSVVFDFPLAKDFQIGVQSPVF